jgi:hypothetical protein
MQPVGMKYDGIARLTTRIRTAYYRNTTAGSLIIPVASHIRTFSHVIGGNTDYDQLAGNVESNFSFKVDDLGTYVESVTSEAATKAESDTRRPILKTTKF